MNLYTFSVVGDGIYAVRDALSGRYTIGEVVRVSRRGPWVAIPQGEQRDGKRSHSTRRNAAHALARFGDTGDRNWIE